MCTTRSISSRPCASRSFSRSRGARVARPRLLLMHASCRYFAVFPSLKIQAAFACRIGQRLDLSVIDITAAVEHHLGDALGLRAFRDELADPRRRRPVGLRLCLLAKTFIERRSMGESASRLVVDDLRVDVLAALEHREPRPRRRAFQLLPDSDADLAARFRTFCRSVHDLLPARLSDFAPDNLIGVLDPFGLVGI